MNVISPSVPNAASDPALGALDGVHAVAVQSADGALPLQGFAPVTKSTAAALTLGTPTAGLPSAGGNDGQTLTVCDTTGAAHTVTTATNKINGSKHIATFGGTIGQFGTFRAYNGIWYLTSSSGITLS